MELYRARDRYSVRMRILGGDDSVSGARNSWPSSIDNNTSALRVRGGMSSWNFHGRGLPRNDTLSASDSQYMNQSGLAVARKKRVHALVSDSHFIWIVQSVCFYAMLKPTLSKT